MIIDAALYKEGKRIQTTRTLEESYKALRSDSGALAWIELNNPNRQEIDSLAHEFEFHDLLLEDIIQAHQRPKLERYESALFVVLHPARYLDKEEEVQFSELHLIIGPDYVVTLRHGEIPNLSKIRARLESDLELLAVGPEAILYAIVDAVVDAYSPVTRGLELDIEQIEYQVFSGDPTVSRRIYELSQEVADFQRAVRPLKRILLDLRSGFTKYEVEEELRSYLRDVEDHLVEVSENTEKFAASLKDILTLNATLMTQRQMEEIRALNEASAEENDAMKKISAWAAIIFAPSLVGGIYGMNFDTMPELHWLFGYPFALGLMLLVAGILFGIFKKKKWI
jgi:magnesium transporter